MEDDENKDFLNNEENNENENYYLEIKVNKTKLPELEEVLDNLATLY